MKRYTVVYTRDQSRWWVASVRSVSGVHTQGRSIDEARRRIREALALALGDDEAETAELVDRVTLPAQAQRKVAALKRALAAEAVASARARKAARAATLALTGTLRLSRRDTAELTGYSFQRIQQLVEGHSQAGAEP